jgi:hypothetical protein
VKEAVTLRKRMDRFEEQLPENTKRYKQETQYPVVDFPLVIAK